METKTGVHLDNGILHSRKKEGTPTLINIMDGTGEHYAKWNKPGGEGQIPYDLTFNWNLIPWDKSFVNFGLSLHFKI